MGRVTRQLGAPKRSRLHVVFGGVALAGFLTYAMVIPYMMISNISGKGSTTTVRIHRAGLGNSLISRRLLGKPLQLQQQQRQEQQQQQQQQQETLTWQRFWNSEHEKGLRTLQQLKHTLDMLRHQRLTKDVEDQATAGLDIMLAEQLAQLSNVTKLYKTQAWLRTEVTDAVWQYLHDLQHPANCTTARKLLCDLNKACGFGCQVHHVVHCLANAIALNRTMVLKVFPSNYITQPHAWEDQMLNVSKCTINDLTKKKGLPQAIPAQRLLLDDVLEVGLDIIDSGASDYDPPALPQDVLEVVQLFNARPGIWWTGFLSAYVMRPSANSVQRQAAFMAAQSWSSPIVGVHVRRTDKLELEAKLHQAEEYMRHVERYCDMKLSSGWQQRAVEQHHEHAAGVTKEREAGTSNTRYSECSVYLASDDTAVAYELREKYKHIHFIVNNMALKASDTSKRFSTDGLMGILDDITYLAATDLLVGTLSSQVSRLAYEINQVNHTATAADRAFFYHSVDSMWYYGGQLENEKCAAYDYTDMGSVSVPKGTVLSCPIINEYEPNTGLMHCFIEDNRKSVMLPPGAVVDCVPSLAGTDNHWYILPHHMRRPFSGPVVGNPASGGFNVTAAAAALAAAAAAGAKAGAASGGLPAAAA